MIYGQLDVYFVVLSGHPDWPPKKCDSRCFIDTKFIVFTILGIYGIILVTLFVLLTSKRIIYNQFNNISCSLHTTHTQISCKFSILLHVLAYPSIKYACRYTHLAAVIMNINEHCQELCCVYSETNTISLVIQRGGPAVQMGLTPLIEIIVNTISLVIQWGGPAVWMD